MEDANEEVLQSKTCRFLLEQRVAEVINIKRELEVTKESLRGKEEKLNAKEAECSEIRNGNDKFKKINRNLGEKIQKMEEVNAELKTEMKKLEEVHAKLKNKLEKMEGDHAELKTKKLEGDRAGRKTKNE